MPASLSMQVNAPTINTGVPGLIQADTLVIAGRWAKDILQVAKKYPRKRYKQVYKRTFTLKEGWRIVGPTVTANGVEVSVVNDVPYVEKAYGDQQGKGQSFYLKDRWKTQPEILASGENLQRQLQAAINRRLSQFFR